MSLNVRCYKVYDVPYFLNKVLLIKIASSVLVFQIY